MSRKTDKLFAVTEGAQAVFLGILVKDTMRYCSQKAGLIWLPENDRKDLDKDGLEPVEVGEVISVGCMVPPEIKVGDVLLYRRITAYGMPNGMFDSVIWKLEWPFSIVAKINGAE
jgi:hypothetical protein